MPTIAAILGAFLFAGYIQGHEIGAPKTTYTTDSQRVTYINNTPGEFEEIISTHSAAPVDIYARATPLIPCDSDNCGKEPK